MSKLTDHIDFYTIYGQLLRRPSWRVGHCGGQFIGQAFPKPPVRDPNSGLNVF